jgi:SNF2 family DNA or RNA helicase
VKALRRKSAFAVTGTPIENRLIDLWSITDLVFPGHLGGQKGFEATYTDDLESAARLEALVSPIMLRRCVAEVATDLPDRIDIPQAIDLEPAEAEAYERVRQDIFNHFGTAATLVSLGALRMFCAHPSLVATQAGDVATFSKMQRLLEILEEIFALGEKVLIFTSYTKMADMIADQIIRRFGLIAEVLDGRTGIEDRQPMIDRFSHSNGAGALILNPRAGGTGLNITAANHVIHYNLEWNPAVEDQASARAFRRGQTKPVTVHRLFVAGTVEEVVDERVCRKRALSGAAVVGVEGKDEDYADIVAALQRSPLCLTDGNRV